MTNGAVSSDSDLIEDMMLLNEEVEDIERRLQTANKLLQQLGNPCSRPKLSFCIGWLQEILHKRFSV